MECPQCKRDLDPTDFVGKQTICYKCSYRNKTCAPKKETKKRRKPYESKIFF